MIPRQLIAMIVVKVKAGRCALLCSELPIGVSARPAGEYGRTVIQLARSGTDRG
jgi:hypothetical protein